MVEWFHKEEGMKGNKMSIRLNYPSKMEVRRLTGGGKFIQVFLPDGTIPSNGPIQVRGGRPGKPSSWVGMGMILDGHLRSIY